MYDYLGIGVEVATASKVGEGSRRHGVPVGDPAAPPRPPAWSSYIIRRLIAAVVLLLIVSVVTFAIFFLVPRLAGADAGRPGVAVRRQDRRRRGTIHAHRGASSASPTRLRAVRALPQGHRSSAPTTTPARRPCTARRRASGYSFINQNPVLPDLLDRLPVTLSLAAGAAVLWLCRRGHHRRDLGAATGQRVRPGRDGRRARRRLAADLLHRPAVPVDLQLQAGLDRARRDLHAASRTTRRCGPTTCCCRGSRWRSSTRRRTPG